MLQKHFKIGHVRDNNTTNRKDQFSRNVINVLKKYDVVIADRNNHILNMRKTFVEEISKFYPKTKFIALAWDIKGENIIKVFNTTNKRIINRRNNHQSLIDNEAIYDSNSMLNFLDTYFPR